MIVRTVLCCIVYDSHKPTDMSNSYIRTVVFWFRFRFLYACFRVYFLKKYGQFALGLVFVYLGCCELVAINCLTTSQDSFLIKPIIYVLVWTLINSVHSLTHSFLWLCNE